MNFGRYEVKKEIGQGGMATVYLAVDPNLQREVAIKVLAPELSNNPEFARRFQREALAIARLEHPAILPIYDFGTDQGANFIVMRLLLGGTLNQRLDERGPLSLTELLSILRPIASALDYAHSLDIIHRDIKPSNIGFDDKDNPLLMDFGIAALFNSQDGARLTRTGAWIGTPDYMAPEQVQGGTITGAADIYALGIVAFEGLTRQVPFPGESPIQIAYAHVTQPIPDITSIRPSLPKVADAVFSKVLAKNPSARYASAIAFIEALEQIAKKYVEEEIVIKAAPVHPVASTIFDAPFDWPARRSIRIILRDAWRDLTFTIRSMVDRNSSIEFFPQYPPPPPPPPPITLPPITLPPPPSPDLPENILNVARPTMILLPQVHSLLAPVSYQTIKDLIDHLKPKRIINYAVTYGGGRFIITGYGSFGGTSLIEEICRLIEQEWGSASFNFDQQLLTIQLNSQEAADGNHLVFKASIREWSYTRSLGTFAIKVEDGHAGVQPLGDLFDSLANGPTDPRFDAHIRQDITRVGADTNRIVLTIDKVNRETAEFILAHPVINDHQMTLIMVVEREDYNRWPSRLKDQLPRQLKFQHIYIPCLWEPKYELVAKTMNLLFHRIQTESDEAVEKLKAFQKHIAYKGRGQTGTMLYELRQPNYWEIDKESRHAFIPLDTLDDELIIQHAWIQDLLDANWAGILGTSFPGLERTDRAKQGVYSLMDWIIDSATFTLEEVLEMGGQLPIWITDHKRLRDDVIVRLLEVLVNNNYLKRVKNEFDIVWGRDLADDVMGDLGHKSKARQVAILQKRLDALIEEYEAVQQQLGEVLGEPDRLRLKREGDRIDSAMKEIQDKLDSIG